MENKEIRNTAAELNDETLENVNGGLLVPIPSAAISLFHLTNRTRTALPGCGLYVDGKHCRLFTGGGDTSRSSRG